MICNGIEKWKNTSYNILNNVLETLIWEIQQQDDHTARFRNQLMRLGQSHLKKAQATLTERVLAASTYYTNLFRGSFEPIIQEQIGQLNDKTPEDLTNSLKTVSRLLEYKIIEFSRATEIAAGSANETPTLFLLKLIAKPFEQALVSNNNAAKKTRPLKKDQSVINKSLRLTLQLYQEGNSISEIASVKNISLTTVQGHLAELVLLGMVDAVEMINNQRLEEIAGCVSQHGKDVNLVKIALGPDYSFFEVRLVVNHLQFKENQSRGHIS